MTPQMLEPFYSKWEAQYIENNKDINNPKIPLKYVRENGIKVFMHNDNYSLNSAPITDIKRPF